MKRAILSFIVAIAAFITTGAQTEERFTYTQMWSFDTLKLDSMYRSWEECVEASPKDEQAWRNLFEIYNARKVITPMEQQDAYRRACNVMQRMEQAIPKSYTFYCSAYQGGYEYEKYRPIAHFAGWNTLQMPISTSVLEDSNVSEHKLMVENAL